MITPKDGILRRWGKLAASNTWRDNTQRSNTRGVLNTRGDRKKTLWRFHIAECLDKECPSHAKQSWGSDTSVHVLNNCVLL